MEYMTEKVIFEFFHQSKKVFIRSRVSLVMKLNQIFNIHLVHTQCVCTRIHKTNFVHMADSSKNNYLYNLHAKEGFDRVGW